MNNKEIKIVFFDIGGVLLSNGWDHISRQKAAKKFSLDYGAMEALHQFVAALFDTGKITLDEYLDIVVFNQPRTFAKSEFKAFMLSQSIELPDMLQWLKGWKKDSGYTVFSLNNESRELNDYRIGKFCLHDCFDAFISSCDVGLRKPDPGIFLLAMNIAHAPPEQCIYFDDRPMLVARGKRMGMNAFQHKGLEETKTILENL